MHISFHLHSNHQQERDWPLSSGEDPLKLQMVTFGGPRVTAAHSETLLLSQPMGWPRMRVKGPEAGGKAPENEDLEKVKGKREFETPLAYPSPRLLA